MFLSRRFVVACEAEDVDDKVKPRSLQDPAASFAELPLPRDVGPRRAQIRDAGAVAQEVVLFCPSLLVFTSTEFNNRVVDSRALDTCSVVDKDQGILICGFSYISDVE